MHTIEKGQVPNSSPEEHYNLKCGYAARNSVFLSWRKLGVFEQYFSCSSRQIKNPYLKTQIPFWITGKIKLWIILWELNSFLMQTLSFVPINLYRCWPREWKHSIGDNTFIFTNILRRWTMKWPLAAKLFTGEKCLRMLWKMTCDRYRVMSLAKSRKCARNVVQMKEAMAAFFVIDSFAISCHCKRWKIILVRVLT